MKKNWKKLLSLLLALTMVAALLSGCGGGGGDVIVDDGSGTGTAAPSGDGAGGGSTAAPTGGGDGVLDVGYSIGLDTLTPFRSNVGQDSPFMTQLFESLAVINADREYEPWAAKGWETTDGGFTYDVEIWDNITDSAGNHITADDIVWEIEETIAAALRPDFAKIESVTKTGDYTVQIKLKENMTGLFESLMKHTFVISKAAYEASPDQFGTDAVTTSAYKVTEFTASSIIRFEKRDDYWQDESLMPESVRPVTEKITYHCIPEASQMGIALETGVIDIAYRLDASTGAQFLDNPNFTVELTDNMQGFTLFFSGADNQVVGNNVELRQAICYAIDVQGLITGVCAGYGTPMYDVCPPSAIGYNPKWDTEPYYEYDLEKAKELIAASGYNNEEISILCTSSSQRMAEIIQNYLVAAGLNCTINAVDMALLTSIRLDGTKYGLFINTIGATTLANHWSIRYDPNAYATGDGTSRHDYVLGDMLYKTWSVEGYTEENIDEVHYYLKDNAIAYGLHNPKFFTVWRNDINVINEVKEYAGYITPSASEFGNL